MTLDLITQLIKNLNGEGIIYSHWKSNFHLANAFSGETDLDLLIDRQSLSDALNILMKLGFKQAVTKLGIMMPGICHYYGYDSKSGQLVHIHLFTRILTGESFVKSHLLPIEMMLLENTYNINQIKVVSKPAELILFVLRTFIKYGSILDLIKIAREAGNIRAELHWLLADNDLPESLSLLKKYCPVIEEQLFLNCIDTLDKENALIKSIFLAQRVRRRLHVYRKNNLFICIGDYIKFIWDQVLRRLSGRKKNKMLNSGGMVIAFVGPDATGKSTLVSETNKWLEKVFMVRVVHAGIPPSSLITLPVNLVLPLVRQLWPRLRTSQLEEQSFQADKTETTSKFKGLSGLVYASRSVSLAWDRRQLLIKARRSAANGMIVICDRYPTETIGAMDSPQLHEKVDKDRLTNLIFNWLARLENRLYAEIPPPDIVLKLNVSIETAKSRNKEREKVDKETDVYLESRHRHNRELTIPGVKYIFEIDTDQSLSDTVQEVKQVIWGML